MKRMITLAILSVLMLVLSACGDEKNPADNTSEPKKEGEVLSQFAEDDGTMWEEEWEIKTASGDAVKAVVSATVRVPRISQMSTVEVKKYELNSENKKRIAEAVFDGEIYYGDEEKLPRAELQKLLDQEQEDQKSMEESWEESWEMYKEEWADDEELLKQTEREHETELAEVGDRIKKYEEMVRKAPEDYQVIKENDYQGDRYIGEKDGVLFSLEFEETSVYFSPFNREEVFPEKAKGFDGFVSDAVGAETSQQMENLKNECSIEKADAEKMARGFMQKAGFSDMVLEGTKDLLWDMSPNGRIDERECLADGWVVEFGVGTDGVAFDSFGIQGGDTYQIGNEQYPAEEKYPLGCHLYIQITDQGIIRLEYYAPVEVQSVTPEVKLLPLKDIKEIIKNGMGGYAQFCLDRSKGLMSAVRFNYMELVYYRMSDPEDENRFTYVPAWRLRKGGSEGQQLYYIVNAIDGSEIRDWESTWTLSVDWI